MNIQPIQWNEKTLRLLDQTRIPDAVEYRDIHDLDGAIDAICKMIVRGAPAIAITGAYGIVLYFIQAQEKPEYKSFLNRMNDLVRSRPTAVNLAIVVKGFLAIVAEKGYDTMGLDDLRKESLQFASNLYDEDIRQNRQIGNYSISLFSNIPGKKISILTHCNTGSLATAGFGTALGVIRTLRDEGYDVTVYADETRPYLQGSRLTAWEMQQEGIDCYIITDSMAGWLMTDRKIDAVVVGADRIAANGDTANKIGTYSLSILAKEHDVPFFVAGTSDSFDFSLSSGKEIEIEMRSPDELLQYSFMKGQDGRPLFPPGLFAPRDARALNPAFDITPAKNIRAIFTEKGVIHYPDEKSIKQIILSSK